MKITDIKLIPVNKFLFVKVYTDEGITGIGESGDWGFLESSGEVIKSFPGVSDRTGSAAD